MPAEPLPGLLDRSLSEILGALASSHELAGGGGPAAAITAAAAAALTAKAARGSRATWIEAGGAIAHAESLRMQAQALAERDAKAYREASPELQRAERSARRGVAAPAATVRKTLEDRQRLAGEAQLQAADLALAIAEAAGQIAQLGVQVAARCPSSLRPEALTAVALAEAAACACASLVDVNRRLAADDPRREAAREAARTAREARDHAF